MWLQVGLMVSGKLVFLNGTLLAGALLVQEAGGIVGDFEGNGTWIDTGNIVAGNPKVFAQILQVLTPHLTDDLKSNYQATISD
jgi:myo-inositol-1(or 4)-monophosphatase